MKKITLLLSALLTSTLLFAQTATGVPHIVYPGFYPEKWLSTNPAYVQQVDGKYVETKTFRSTQINVYFRDFGFKLPSTAVIQGIDVRVSRKKKGVNEVRDVTVALLKPINDTEAAGNGPNLAKPDNWSETLTTVLYPFGPTSIDGNQQSFRWAPVDVNHPAFGLFFGTSIGSGKGASFQFDKVELTIRYTQNTMVITQSKVAGGQEENTTPAIRLQHLGSNIQVSIPNAGRYLLTIRNSAGAVLQQTPIQGGKTVLVPINTSYKGWSIITVEGLGQRQSLQTMLK